MSYSHPATRYLDSEKRVRSFDEMPKLIKKLREQGVTVILAQGVFDIVHLGHVGFLRAGQAIDSKNGIVIVGIDNDETVRLNKGNARPINTAEDRAQFISEFISAGIVFTYADVPRYTNVQDYIDRYKTLNPSSVLAPSWDPYLKEKEWQARKAHTRLSTVDYRHVNSTSLLLKKVGFTSN